MQKKNSEISVSPDALVPHAETTAAAIDSGVDVVVGGGGGAEEERADEGDEALVARADAGNLGILRNSLECTEI